MSDLVFADDRLTELAIPLRQACPLAYDIMRAAPVLALAIERERRRMPGHRLWSVMSEFTRAAKLLGGARKMLDHYSIPRPLAKIPAFALYAGSCHTLTDLEAVDPRVLGQAITNCSDFDLWWSVTTLMLERASRRYICRDWPVLREWLVLHLASVNHTAGLADMVDFFVAEGFNPAWSLEGALRRSDEWHKSKEDENLQKRYADPDAIAPPLSEWPETASFNDFKFVLLNTPRKLHEEGAAMNHCVSSYWHDVKRSSSVIYSIRDASGNRLATAEYFNGPGAWDLVQCQARFNKEPSARVLRAGRAFCCARTGAGS